MEMLQVQKGKIVDSQGKPVFLRGFAVGGWMNLEHFMNGYPGAEHQLRAVMAQELGAKKAEFFFDRLLDYFFTEDDVAYIRSLGATVIRPALNYRHFESDEHPVEYLEAGFARLEQMLSWCRKHGLYVILDMHAVQGWHNSDWHGDNASRHSFFWHNRQFQDRYVALWQEIARRYAADPVIAGYDLMNEPLVGAPFGRFRENTDIYKDTGHYCPDWERMNGVYRRVVETIRAVDPNHIIFMEGDYFAGLFHGLEAPFSTNLAYSSHNYNPGISENWGIAEQRQWHDRHEGTQFTRQHNAPLYVGEFGAGMVPDPVAQAARMKVIDAQMQLFNQNGDHWTIWSYKDIGAAGSVYLKPDSAYVQAIQPVLNTKRALETDFFGSNAPAESPVKKKLAELARLIEAELQDPTLEPGIDEGYLAQHLLSGYVSQLMQKKFAQCFAGMDEAEIDRVLQSHLLQNCLVSEPTLDVLKKRFAD